MIKMILLLKRRPDISVADFQSYYEKHHAWLGRKYFDGIACRYMRRYTAPPPGKPEAIPEFDVITEVWFKDEAAYAASRERLSAPGAMEEIVADEKRLFGGERLRLIVREEHESPMSCDE